MGAGWFGFAVFATGLHMPALSAIRNEERFKTIFVRLVSKHGVKMKAAVAVQRKLLELMYTLYKTNKPKRSPKKNKRWQHENGEATAKLIATAPLYRLAEGRLKIKINNYNNNHPYFNILIFKVLESYHRISADN